MGTARIVRKNWKGILHSGNSTLAAVASRDAGRSRKLIAEYQHEAPFDKEPVALGSYEELLASHDIDAVYIPLPTGLRKGWVVRAAEAGKHVLCEKPCAPNTKDLEEMIAACRRNKVQFMDGVMFMHNPRLNHIRKTLDDGKSIGPIRRITSHFSFCSGDDFLQENIRADSTLEPLGCLGDLGWYCIRFALWTMNWHLPREVSGRILSKAGTTRGGKPVPFDFSGELLFENDISCGFHCSFRTAYSNWAMVIGTQGHLRVPDFVLPAKSSEGALEINGTLSDNGVMDPLTMQESNMFRNFADQVASGKLNSDWPNQALKTQLVTNACLTAALNSQPVQVLPFSP